MAEVTNDRSRGSVRRYGVSALATAVAVGARMLADPLVGDEVPFATMFGATAFAVWYGGRRAAALTAITGYIALDFLVVPPRGTLSALTTLPGFIGAVAYTISCCIIVALGRGMQVAKRRAAQGEQELLTANRVATRRADELQALFDAAPIAIWVAHDPECRVVTANRFATELAGRTREWAVPPVTPADTAGFALLRHDARVAPSEHPLQRAARGESIGGEEYDLPVAGPQGVTLNLSAVPLLDERGAVRGAIAVATDISEQKRATASARGAERLLRLITDTMPVLISYIDCDYRYRLVNRSYEVWFQQSHADMVGRTVAEVIGEEAWQRLQPFMARALSGETVSFEDEVLYKHAGRRWINAAYVPQVEPDGKIAGIAVLVTDLTERHRAEDAVRRSEQAQRLLVALHDATRNLHDPTLALDALTSRIGAFFGAARVLYGVVDDAQGFISVAHDHADGVPSLAGRYAIGDLLLPGMDALRAGRAVVVPDTHDGSTDPAALALHDAIGVRAMLTVPLVKEGQLVAILALAETQPRGWTLDETWLLEQVAERLWVTMENAHAEVALKEADRQKDEFLAVLAHELRNPLAPIRNAAQFLQLGGRLEPDVRGALDIIDRQVHHLVRLVDDLLDVSRISRGKINLQRADVALAVIVGNAIEAARPVMESLGHEFTVSLPPTPVRLHADVTRLAQVLTNLLHNSAKYTPPGGRISLTASVDDAYAVITVRDNGIGIPEEMLPRIFRMFTQVDQSLERSAGGLGIGLTLVERLVSLHDGDVEARSGGAGEGSEFVVRLPIQRTPSTDTPAPPEARAPLASSCILIVDDNVDSADSLAMMFTQLGHDVHKAYDGRTGFEAAARVQPAILLLDIGLPVHSGYDVARMVRREAWGASTLIVAISGWGQESDRRRSQEAGFDHHLVKPVDHSVLLALLADHTSRG